MTALMQRPSELDKEMVEVKMQSMSHSTCRLKANKNVARLVVPDRVKAILGLRTLVERTLAMIHDLVVVRSS